ncbi:MAG TPA: cytochrome c, partial [Thermoanaerobaculia bacterium]|nr:cytochrome c [Thermoanaerobaculia bacterium]
MILLLIAMLAGDGRAIYEKGEGASPIVARISGGSEVPASALPCIGCHGADGRGRTEGGVTPSDIRSAELTKPYEVTTANGRRRAPYTDALLRRAITMGVDSSGHHFDPLMPRFQMTRADLDQLITYLHILGTTDVPG